MDEIKIESPSKYFIGSREVTLQEMTEHFYKLDKEYVHNISTKNLMRILNERITKKAHTNCECLRAKFDLICKECHSFDKDMLWAERHMNATAQPFRIGVPEVRLSQNQDLSIEKKNESR